MSTSSDIVQYYFSISATQPGGNDLSIQFNLIQTGTFGDTEASALYGNLLAQVPTGWTADSSLTKVDDSTTQWNWNATAAAFQ